jgi:hypothetical protein
MSYMTAIENQDTRGLCRPLRVRAVILSLAYRYLDDLYL